MAGIGFELKKLFGDDDMISKKAKAYIYSTFVSVGPWIITIITLNLLTLFADVFMKIGAEKTLFMGTVVYSFVFSQIVTTPWQMIITRYISDMLYEKNYTDIRASLFGLSKIMVVINFTVPFIYYYNKNLPVYYKFFAISLFILIGLVWIYMVYLTAVKNYKVITRAYTIGGIIIVALTFYLIKRPLYFPEHKMASNILLAYLIGMAVLYVGLLYSFLRSFDKGSKNEFDFLRYFNKVPSLFFIGLFYVLALWVDDILIWFSILGINILDVYRFAPIYDTAIFLSYLSTIPTYVFFVVSIETVFYEGYKKYYNLIASKGTFNDIEKARVELKEVMWREIIHVMETQALITVTIIVLSGATFHYLGYPKLLADIFRLTSLGAYCNVFVLIVILILLYFEMRKPALAVAVVQFVLCTIFTLIFLPYGEDFYGVGLFTGSFIALVAGIFVLIKAFDNITYFTFFSQPLFKKKENRIDVYFGNLREKNRIEAEQEENYDLKHEKIKKYYLYAIAGIGLLTLIVIFTTRNEEMHLRTLNKLDLSRKALETIDKTRIILGHETEKISQSISRIDFATKENLRVELTNTEIVFRKYSRFPDETEMPKLKRAGAIIEEILKEDRGIFIIIKGFTDEKGDKEYKNKISLTRAENIKNYILLNKNIDGNRIKIIGAGEDKSNAADKKRVEFFIEN